jgi:hypothetical protein
MQMKEPITMATDFLLGGVSVVCAFLLIRRHTRPQMAWGAGLGFAGLASFLGGAYHGWFTHSPATGPQLLWKATLLSIGCAALALWIAAAQSWFPQRARLPLVVVGAAILVAYSVWIWSHISFIWAIADYGSTMILILVLAIANAWRGDAGAKWIAGGILISFAAAVIQQLPVHAGSLNHNDIYHVVQIVGVIVIFRGAGKLSATSS